MKKSVYSLMLFDEIVERIDQLAYERDTNRSQLINDILAEQIGMETPEQKIQKILETLDDNFADTLAVSQITKNCSIQFGKSLKFKYRPKVRYSYEFINNGEGKSAVLKISSRTKSPELNDHFENFFKMIENIEQKHTDVAGQEHVTNHKFVREFGEEASLEHPVDEVSQRLSDYLRMIDTAMNIYFSEEASQDLNVRLEEIYENYIK